MNPLRTSLPWLPTPPVDIIGRCKALTPDTEKSGEVVQFLAGHRLQSNEYTALTRAIKKMIAAKLPLAPLSSFKLGILSGSTFDLLLDYLPTAAARHGVALEVLSTPYDQAIQQALDPDSSINTGQLDGCLVAVDHRWLKLDSVTLGSNPQDRVDSAIEQLRLVVNSIAEKSGTPVILQSIPSPSYSLFGNYERQVAGTIRSMIEIANVRILELARETGSYIFDVNTLAQSIGTDHWFDPVQWYSYKLPFSSQCFPAYADSLGVLLGAIRGKSRKCLVLDLDNTIWGGAVGDVGVAGIVLAEGSPKGEAFLSVQRTALELRERGILLAICSKNFEEAARSPFREHPEMILREKHITSFQANWSDKASNLKAIASELNIGLDALVFLDDNPAEREFIRCTLPMVAVPELPSDPSWFVWHLLSAGYFETVSISAEDANRAESYSADVQRSAEHASATDITDYLRALDMTMSVMPFDLKGRRRIAQLINKTNQFNLTTRRYTEAEVAAMEIDERYNTLQFRLNDKYGDLGMIAVVICRRHDEVRTVWEIDSWLMSCRVLGRKVEEAMLAQLVQTARESGVSKLVGWYVPTSKNSMVENHYGNLGFNRTGESTATGTRWELALSSYIEKQLPIRMICGHPDQVNALESS